MSEATLLLAMDLDGTLFRSYRDRQPGDAAVDGYGGKPCAFLSPEAADLLAELADRVRLVPVTTRSVEQYRRIEWPAGLRPSLAVTSNGGCLLRNDVPDAAWQTGAHQIVSGLETQLERLANRLGTQAGVRKCVCVERLFVYAACEKPDQARALQETSIGAGPFVPVASGRKLYLLPPGLDKGAALRRLRALPDFSGVCLCMAAGDSALDIPMLRQADCAVVPPALSGLCGVRRVLRAPDRSGLPEYVLRQALALASAGSGVDNRI